MSAIFNNSNSKNRSLVLWPSKSKKERILTLFFFLLQFFIRLILPCFEKFSSRKFYTWLLFIDWNETLKIDEQNVDYSTEVFLNKTDLVLNYNHAPLKN